MRSINLLSPEVTINPFPLYHILREHHPICQLEPGGIWAISRFDDARLALKRSDLFTSAGFISEIFRPAWLDESVHKHLFVLEEDPPLHTQHRALINKAFVHRVIDDLQPLMRATASQQLRRLQSESQPDFVRHFAYPYIGTIIGKLIGIDDYLDLTEMQAVLRLMKNMTTLKPPPAEIGRLQREIAKFFRVIERVIDDRQRSPQADLVTALIQAQVDGESLKPRLIRDAIDLILTAGLDTTIGLLCNSMLSLSEKPQLLSTLKESPELIPAFVEEQLRHNPPTHRLMRRTTSAVEMHGVTIPAQSFVLVMVAAANRDGAHFDNADRFQLQRENVRDHLSLGYGPHACIGAALARLEVKIALEELLQVAHTVACPPADSLRWEPSLITHAPDNLLPISLR